MSIEGSFASYIYSYHSLNMLETQHEVENAIILQVNKINSGDVAYDPFGMYVIFVSPEINYTGSAEDPADFCDKSCGMYALQTVSPAMI